MTYPQTLDYLFEKLPMFTRQGAIAYKPDLENILKLCARINNPERKFKSIHIAGTNGKGSCSHMLAAIFQNAGYKTGLYTSPHVIDFRERIKIDGQKIEENWIVNFVKKRKDDIEELKPSFFELTVAMAFEYFAEQKVDVAVVEVGLGGLLDSTNIIHPEISVITNISLDHTNLLGNTLQEIAFQKAGIIKENTPVVIGESQAETVGIFVEKANQLHSPIFFADKQFELHEAKELKGALSVVVLDKGKNELKSIVSDLNGNYQIKNIRTVLTTIENLKRIGWQISDSNILDALKQTKRLTGIMGRFDLLQENPSVIADVAHNEAGLKEVFAQIQTFTYDRLHIITGFVRDKDVEKVLNLFPQNALYYFTQADIPRALPVSELSHLANDKNLKGRSFANVTDALKSALSNATSNDLILITGSFFILGDVYHFFEVQKSL